jgi:hypothetical protein
LRLPHRAATDGRLARFVLASTDYSDEELSADERTLHRGLEQRRRELTERTEEYRELVRRSVAAPEEEQQVLTLRVKAAKRKHDAAVVAYHVWFERLARARVIAAVRERCRARATADGLPGPLRAEDVRDVPRAVVDELAGQWGVREPHRVTAESHLGAYLRRVYEDVPNPYWHVYPTSELPVEYWADSLDIPDDDATDRTTASTRTKRERETEGSFQKTERDRKA